jgi:hypothetical protein
MRRTLYLPLFLLLGVVGCERSSRAEPAEARREAARNACAAAELIARSHDNYQTLAALAETGSVGPANAALEFTRVYANHAALRGAAFARVDSAANHARTTADSIRYMEAAVSFLPGRPEPESMEANVVAAYNRDFVEIRDDGDHRCNWAI